jgi:hypothetical protein
MEQILSPLLAELNAMRQKIDSNGEGMRTKQKRKEATMEANYEKMDTG